MITEAEAPEFEAPVTEEIEAVAEDTEQLEAAEPEATTPQTTPDEFVAQVKAMLPECEARRDCLIGLIRFAVIELAPSSSVSFPYGPFVNLDEGSRYAFAKGVQTEALARLLNSIGMDPKIQQDTVDLDGNCHLTVSIVPTRR